MKTFHLTLHEGLSAVYIAQVARPMSVLRDRGMPVELVAFARVGEFLRGSVRRQWTIHRNEIEGVFGLDLNILPAPPSRLAGLWSEATWLARWYRKRRNPETPVRFYCRGPKATLAAMSLRATFPEVGVVFDCRGVNGLEYAYERGYSDIESAPSELRESARVIEAIEREAAKGADRMICVSEAMRRVVSERWGVDATRIFVVPCCTDTANARVLSSVREAVRVELGLGERFTLVYSGSVSAWQMPEETIALFGQMCVNGIDAHLLVVTTQIERFRAVMGGAGVSADRVTVFSVPHKDVARYLAAADAGLLIRERCLVNEVASPVKFAEYLAAGLPVVIGDGVGDCSGWVREHGLGVVLDRLPTMLSADECRRVFQQVRQVNRESCQEFARERLDWQAYAEQVHAVFDSPSRTSAGLGT